MTSVGQPILLDFVSDASPATMGDLASVGDAVVATWIQNLNEDPSNDLFLQAVHAITFEKGPKLTIPGFSCRALRLIEVDSVLWLAICTSSTSNYYTDPSQVRLARITVNSALEISVDWKATVDNLYLGYSGINVSFVRYKDRLILGVSGGSAGNAGAYVTTAYMFDLEGALLTSVAGPLSGGSPLWLICFSANPWTDELFISGNIYSSGYHQSIWTMPLTSAGFGGTWTRRNDLSNEYGDSMICAGTPGGWEVLWTPSYPSSRTDLVSLNTDTSTRSAKTINAYSYDGQHDFAIRGGLIVCIDSYGWNPGFAYGRIDSDGPTTDTLTSPDGGYSSNVQLTRIAATSDGWMVFTSASNTITPQPGAVDPHARQLWPLSLENGHFPPPAKNDPTPDQLQANFRRTRR